MLHGRTRELISQLAMVLIFAIFGVGAAGGQIYQQLVNHDHAVNNGGLLLIMDIAIPAVGIVFAIWTAIARHRAAAQSGSRITETAGPARYDDEYV
jgi:hypothetical protein